MEVLYNPYSNITIDPSKELREIKLSSKECVADESRIHEDLEANQKNTHNVTSYTFDKGESDLFIEHCLKQDKNSIYLGCCTKDSPLVDHFISPMESMSLSLLKPTISKVFTQKKLTIIIKISHETDYNTLEKLNDKIQSAKNGNDNHQYIFVVEPDQASHLSQHPSVSSRIWPFSLSNNGYSKKWQQFKTNNSHLVAKDKTQGIQVNISNGLLEIMTKNECLDGEKILKKNIFLEYMDNYIKLAKMHNKPIIFDFDFPPTPEDIAILIQLNSGKCLLYDINFESDKDQVSFKYTVKKDGWLTDSLKRKIDGLQIKQIDQKVDLSQISTITDLSIDDLSDTLKLKPSHTQEIFGSHKKYQGSSILINTQLSTRTWQKINTWLEENSSHVCYFGHSDCLVKDIAPNSLELNSPITQNPTETITAASYISSLKTSKKITLFGLSHNPISPILGEKKFPSNDNEYLLLDPSIPTELIIESLKSGAKITTTRSILNKCSQYGPIIDSQNLTIIDWDDNDDNLKYLSQQIQTFNQTPTDVVKMRYLYLIYACNCSKEEAFKLSITNGLDNDEHIEPNKASNLLTVKFGQNPSISQDAILSDTFSTLSILPLDQHGVTSQFKPHPCPNNTLSIHESMTNEASYWKIINSSPFILPKFLRKEPTKIKLTEPNIKKIKTNKDKLTDKFRLYSENNAIYFGSNQTHLIDKISTVLEQGFKSLLITGPPGIGKDNVLKMFDKDQLIISETLEAQKTHDYIQFIKEKIKENHQQFPEDHWSIENMLVVNFQEPNLSKESMHAYHEISLSIRQWIDQEFNGKANCLFLSTQNPNLGKTERIPTPSDLTKSELVSTHELTNITQNDVNEFCKKKLGTLYPPTDANLLSPTLAKQCIDLCKQNNIFISYRFLDGFIDFFEEKTRDKSCQRNHYISQLFYTYINKKRRIDAVKNLGLDTASELNRLYSHATSKLNTRYQACRFTRPKLSNRNIRLFLISTMIMGPISQIILLHYYSSSLDSENDSLMKTPPQQPPTSLNSDNKTNVSKLELLNPSQRPDYSKSEILRGHILSTSKTDVPELVKKQTHKQNTSLQPSNKTAIQRSSDHYSSTSVSKRPNATFQCTFFTEKEKNWIPLQLVGATPITGGETLVYHQAVVEQAPFLPAWASGYTNPLSFSNDTDGFQSKELIGFNQSSNSQFELMKVPKDQLIEWTNENCPGLLDTLKDMPLFQKINYITSYFQQNFRYLPEEHDYLFDSIDPDKFPKEAFHYLLTKREGACSHFSRFAAWLINMPTMRIIQCDHYEPHEIVVVKDETGKIMYWDPTPSSYSKPATKSLDPPSENFDEPIVTNPTKQDPIIDENLLSDTQIRDILISKGGHREKIEKFLITCYVDKVRGSQDFIRFILMANALKEPFLEGVQSMVSTISNTVNVENFSKNIFDNQELNILYLIASNEFQMNTMSFIHEFLMNQNFLNSFLSSIYVPETDNFTPLFDFIKNKPKLTPILEDFFSMGLLTRMFEDLANEKNVINYLKILKKATLDDKLMQYIAPIFSKLASHRLVDDFNSDDNLTMFENFLHKLHHDAFSRKEGGERLYDTDGVSKAVFYALRDLITYSNSCTLVNIMNKFDVPSELGQSSYLLDQSQLLTIFRHYIVPVVSSSTIAYTINPLTHSSKTNWRSLERDTSIFLTSSLILALLLSSQLKKLNNAYNLSSSNQCEVNLESDYTFYIVLIVSALLHFFTTPLRSELNPNFEYKICSKLIGTITLPLIWNSILISKLTPLLYNKRYQLAIKEVLNTKIKNTQSKLESLGSNPQSIKLWGSLKQLTPSEDTKKISDLSPEEARQHLSQICKTHLAILGPNGTTKVYPESLQPIIAEGLLTK